MEIKGHYATSNFFMKRGIEIDLGKKCFRKIGKLFSIFKMTEACEELPEIDYILLFKTAYAKCQACTLADFENSSVVQLSFVYNKNKKLIVHETDNIESAKLLARQLSSELKLSIRDSATDRRNPKWLK
jgi:hypothetical protein